MKEVSRTSLMETIEKITNDIEDSIIPEISSHFKDELHGRFDSLEKIAMEFQLSELDPLFAKIANALQEL